MTEQEELKMLRKLLEKQGEEIEKLNSNLVKKDEIIRIQNIRIENMTQALLHANKKIFGPSTETSKQIEGQLSLFETNEELAKILTLEEKKITVPSHKRVPRKPGVKARMLEGLPKEVVEYVIDEDETCGICNGKLKPIGKELVRTDVEFVPAKLVVTHNVREIRKCIDCGTDKSQYPTPYFKKAALPTPVLPHSIATPSLVAQIMYQKFKQGVPSARQEKDWEQLGLIISRSNMSHWIIRCSQLWFSTVYDKIHQRLLKCNSLHMDETTMQCNKEPGKKASSKSYMWVIRSGAGENIKATYFHYSRTRNGDIAAKLLKGYKNNLTTDAYAGYNKVENTTRNLCWSHVRRYYLESIPLDSNGKEIPGSKGAEGREYINLLFAIEKEIKDLTIEEKEIKRQTASRAILDAFWSWVNETTSKTTSNEKLTKALKYSLNQKEGLESFLYDGSLDISNNLVEASIRPFAVSRRAWLFADTPDGARANAIMYTIVETAKLNNLHIYNYLKFLLEKMPNTDFHRNPNLIDYYLPWSKNLPEDCRLPEKTNKQ